ncbi:hypothetical protein Tco_0618829 [Tanacetum coccineum]
MNESWKLWRNGDGGACKVLEWLLGDVMEGASFTQGTVSSIPVVGSIIPEGFLPPILLLVVIIVTVERVFLSLEFGLLVLAIFAVCASRAVAFVGTSFLNGSLSHGWDSGGC